MAIINILIVENDPNDIQAYEDTIRTFNMDSNGDHIINSVVKTTEKEGLKALEEKEWSAAFIDLKLSTEDILSAEEGNNLVSQIYTKRRFPVYIITNTPGDVSPNFIQSDFLRIRTKDGIDYNEVFNNIINIQETGILKIIGKQGLIEKYLDKIFWENLSTSIDLWSKDLSRNPDQKENSLLRYTILHMLEYLDEENYHPSEFYITKPIKENIFTGDIVEYLGTRYIVLTPSCDIVIRHDGTRNTRRILFCKIKDLKDEVENYQLLTSETASKNKNRLRLNRYIQNNSKSNFHFIPKHNEIDAGLIDFQDKTTIGVRAVERKLAKGECKRVATVSMPFLKDIISRYSNYYGRQGSPDFNSDEIFGSIFH
ncbi:hypothetical protein [Maribacter stanieri]|uniref:hypothetical protein n=1 Tax=Maribacter stanieri TaxID=440514 RepID=UPI0024944B90|nr:hypothetical protein [Maribacter stanieri]